MITRVKEILVAASVICIKDLEKDMKWIAHIKPQLSSLSSLTTSSYSVATTTSYFVSKKRFIQVIYNFTTYDELYIFFHLLSFFDLSYIFCPYFL